MHALILFMASLTALINSPLRALEEPSAQPAGGSPPAASNQAAGRDPLDLRPDKAERGNDEIPTPFIGVLTAHPSAELRAQFGLRDGFGLQVVEVMPDSPAKEAGLKEHDVLLKMNDQQLISMEQLQVLVRSMKSGDRVTFTVITGGKESEVPVTIGERMLPPEANEPGGPGDPIFHPGFSHPEGNLGDARWQQNLKRFQERIGDYQKRLQDWSRSGNRGPMPTPPVFDEGGSRDTDRHFEHHREDHRDASNRSAGVTRRDETGTYSLQRSDDHSVFTVRPKEGGEQVWSFSNETQRNMIPEVYREKLRMLEKISEDMRHGSGPDSHRGPAAPGAAAPEGGSTPSPAPGPDIRRNTF